MRVFKEQLLLLSVLVTLLFVPVSQAMGQAFVDLHDFYAYPNGTAPSNIVQAANGTIYGTMGGGVDDSGVVFSMTPAGTTTILHSFIGPDGQDPNGLTIGKDGNLYGTTAEGGANYFGTVYKLSPRGVLTTLHSFTWTDGGDPVGGVVQAGDGNFYGLTDGGGTSNGGTVYCITPGGALTSLYSFSNTTDGGNPEGNLVQLSDGNLYGATSWSSGNDGTIFKITTGGALTTLYTFQDSADGASPTYLVKGIDGNLYGTTSAGDGTVFKATPAGVLTTLHAFAGPDGKDAFAKLVVGGGGILYGTTGLGGAFGYGTAYSITTSGAFTNLHSFNGTDGNYPLSLMWGKNGNLYGSSLGSFYFSVGPASAGTIYEMTPRGAVTVLRSLSTADGQYFSAPLLQAGDGNFYGTAAAGGASNVGAIIKFTRTGSETILHSFSGPDGIGPSSALIQGSDGNLYGSAPQGGANGYGTLFKITMAGAFTTLYSFNGSDGNWPAGPLAEGSDSNFYGVTQSGGTHSDGTIFQITPGGALTTLYSFTGGADGAVPDLGLMTGSDGNLYGSTLEDGETAGAVLGAGTLFKTTLEGSVTTLYTFSSSTYAVGAAQFVAGKDGNFYGTIWDNQADDLGSVFKLTPAGVFSSLYTFSGLVGNPIGVTADSAGNVYGTLDGESYVNDGTIFEITSGGVYSNLFTFTGDLGTQPEGVILASDGNLYGTTLHGGLHGDGNLFELAFTPASPTGLTATAGNGQIGLAWTDNNGGKSFNVYRSTTSGGEGASPIATGVTRSLFEDTGLTNGTKYFYEVVAVNAGGTSAPSNEASATPHVPAPPVPGRLAATSGDEIASVTWAASAGATSYNVYQSIGGGGYSLVKNTSTTSYNASGLTDGTTYSYEIAAVGGSGASSANSAPVSVTPTGVTIKAGPTVTYRGSMATITWSTNLASQSVVNYGTTPSLGSSASNTAMSTYHSITLTGLSPVKTYFDVSSTDTVTTATSGVANFTP